MTAFYKPLDLSKKQLTVVFLILFTLIKTSPSYYSDQFGTVRSQLSNDLRPIVRPNTNGDKPFLVKVDRSIIEKDATTGVPKIKYSGIAFALFFALVMLSMQKSTAELFFKDALITTQIYLRHSVLRL